MSIGAIEPKFYANLLDALGLDAGELPDQNDVEQWPAMKQRFAEIFRAAAAPEWESRLADLDVCFAPVLSFADAARHPHLVARGTYVDVDGIPQPAPAPRFDRTPATLDRPPAPPGHHTDEILSESGFSADEIDACAWPRPSGETRSDGSSYCANLTPRHIRQAAAVVGVHE